jgi:rubredoxin
MVYALKCEACGHEYGANGSDIHHRRCPGHDGGAAGLRVD